MADDHKAYPHFATNLIHVGQDPEQWKCKAIVPPIFTTTTYKQDEPGQPLLHDYIRDGNPTRTALEKGLASAEDAKYAHVFSSGMAAVSSVIQALLKSGDGIVSVNDVYGGVNRYYRKMASKFGITTKLVDATDVSNIEEAITDNTKIIWMESPTNPTLTVIDLKAIADIAHKKGCTLVVDNTFMTPYFQRPLALGADVVLHSMTKYLNGHCDVLMGALCTNNEEFHKEFKFQQLAVGAIPSPFDCYLANRGLRTLHVRMKQHAINALAIAQYLESSSHVESVLYPGLPSHPQHEIAKRQCRGYGGMVSFRIKGDISNAKKFIKSLKIFTLAESLGGVESLIEIPSLMTHLSVPPEERAILGITDTLVIVCPS
jgi:cystathionine gamma-lyase